jgi:chorismate synthase
MSGNSFGNRFKLSSFGESHGKAIGGVIDGCPAGFELNLEAVQDALDRRKPGQSAIVTQRKETDKVEFLSGIFDGKTTGAPIGFVILNQDQKSKDYNHIKDIFRPSHADFTYQEKYGIRDYRGGGRSSARETAVRVVAGAIAQQFLTSLGVEINAFVSAVGSIKIEESYEDLDFEKTEQTVVRCPDLVLAQQMIESITTIKKSGDTIGGTVSAYITGVPTGWGEPVFDKLHARLGFAMLGINAVKGFQYGSGFEGSKMQGSAHNDIFISEAKTVSTNTNFSGGIQGGISNGMPIYFDVAFKPVATILQKQDSIDINGDKVIAEGKGRHDPCVVPRAVPIVEAMAALVLFDAYLEQKISQW